MEEQLAKRLGRFKSVVAADASMLDPEEELYAVPAELQVHQHPYPIPPHIWCSSKMDCFQTN